MPLPLFGRHQSVTGYLFVVAATLIWSGNFVAARALSNSVPPVTLVFLRSIVAMVILLPFAIKPLCREFAVIREHLGYLALTAFLGLTVSNTVVYVAAATSRTLNLTLIAVCSPIFTVVFARLFLRDTLTARRVIGLITATSGVVFLISDGQPSRLAHLTFSEGDIWMLGQAGSFALYSILVRMKPQELGAVTFLFSLFVLGLIFLLPGLAWEMSESKTVAFSPAVLGAVLYLGIGPSLLAYLFWNESVAIIGPTRAAIVSYCLPLFSGTEALFLLGEPITTVHFVSGLMILAGVVFATRE